MPSFTWCNMILAFAALWYCYWKFIANKWKRKRTEVKIRFIKAPFDLNKPTVAWAFVWYIIKIGNMLWMTQSPLNFSISKMIKALTKIFLKFCYKMKEKGLERQREKSWLIYHIYIMTRNGSWKRHVDMSIWCLVTKNGRTHELYGH